MKPSSLHRQVGVVEGLLPEGNELLRLSVVHVRDDELHRQLRPTRPGLALQLHHLERLTLTLLEGVDSLDDVERLFVDGVHGEVPDLRDFRIVKGGSGDLSS